jgi:hypothetical protein
VNTTAKSFTGGLLRFDLLAIYDGNTGGVIVSADPLHLIATSRLCSAGGAFYAVITNGVITAFVFYPGLT